MNQSNGRGRTGGFSEKVEKLSQGYCSRWKKERISSRRIVKEVQGAIAKSARSAEAFAYFLALQRRVDERYDSLLKTFFRYFSWRRETALLSQVRSRLKLPQDMRAERAIEEEAERRENNERGGERADGTDGRQEKEKKKGGKETDSPSAFARKSDLSEVTADKSAEEEQKESETEETEEKEEPTAEKGRAEKEKDGSEKERSKEPTDPFAAREKAEREGREEKSAPQASPKTEPAKPKPKAPDIPSRPLESDVLSGVFERDVPPRESTATRPPDFYERPRAAIREGDDARAFPREPVLPDIAQDAVRDSSNSAERERAAEKGFLPTEKPILAENPSPAASAKAEMSEENRERIRARDAFAKMSEEELESIRQAMQESLDREMASAEARGEIYKMPIVVKEAIEKGSALSEKPTETSPPNPVAKK